MEEIRKIISAHIEKGLNDPDFKKRVQWRKITCVGESPTSDEWLCYVIQKNKDNDCDNLLRMYSN